MSLYGQRPRVFKHRDSLMHRVKDPSSGNRPPEHELSALVSRFRLVRGYPLQEDNDHIAARDELLGLLTRESLDAAIADAGTFDMDAFMRLAHAHHACYGYPGNQPQINVHLSANGRRSQTRRLGSGTRLRLRWSPTSVIARKRDVASY